jgi:hypothetical protein
MDTSFLHFIFALFCDMQAFHIIPCMHSRCFSLSVLLSQNIIIATTILIFNFYPNPHKQVLLDYFLFNPSSTKYGNQIF